MSSHEYLYNSDFDRAVRSRGFWPYLLVYGMSLFIAGALASPTPVELPLVAHHERAASASVWAFLCAYPVLHIIMKSRVYERLALLKWQLFAVALGFFLLSFSWLPLQFTLSENPVGRTARALASSPVVATVFLFALSVTASIGCFLILEPVRARIARWL